MADLFAGAAKESQGSIVDMGIALKQSSAAAAGLGVSVEDTITLLTQLSRAGLSSSDAGTALRTAFLRLIQNLPKVNEEVAKLGISFRDVRGNLRPEFFEEVGEELRKMTPAARQAAQANLGGADALRVYLLLGREAAGTFDQVQASISQQGLAAEAAAARTSGLSGDVEAAKNELAALGTTAGRVASGPLSFLARTAALTAGAINDMNEEIEETNAPQQLARGLGDLFNNFERINLSFRQGVTGAKNFGEGLKTFEGIAASVTTTVDELADAIQRAGDALTEGQNAPQDEGLGVQQVLNRVAGFDSAETRARIRGDTDELLSVLQAEQDFLRSQLERQFVQNRPALRDRLQDALLGSIQDVSPSPSKALPRPSGWQMMHAERERKADRAFLELLGVGREDIANAAEVAAAEGRAQDAIRLQNKLQARIQDQIRAIRNRIKDEQTRKAAVRELRLALQASRREEEALADRSRSRLLSRSERPGLRSTSSWPT